MDRSNVISLIKETPVQNSFGAWTSTKASSEVFCDVRSISQTEWFEAGRVGIEHPEFIFIINRNEYDGEKIVEYNGQFYGVFRTYAGRNENLELHCEAKGGLINGD